MSQEPDQIIAGKFRLVRRLARGGMGAVWLARHLDLDVDVALKFLRTEDGVNPQAEARFRREARAAAGLKSPHVVQIYDFGLDSGVAYLAMELLSGADLEERLARTGHLEVGAAVGLISQVCRGLRVAHQSGVIHRDIKPSNLFEADIDGDRVVKILDFGIAKAVATEDTQTTTQGLVFGSPAYMSPEQARGGAVDERSDLWSLAAVFYRMLTGSSPFPGANASDMVVKLCTEDVTPPSQLVKNLGPDVDGFFRRALSRDPDVRFQDATEFMIACKRLVGKAEKSEFVRHEGSPGRAEETAPLPVYEGASLAESAGDTRTPGSLRPSLAPGRPPPSGARGVVAVAGVLLLLGGLGLWMARGTTTRVPNAGESAPEGGPPARTGDARNASPPDGRGAGQGSTEHDPVQGQPNRELPQGQDGASLTGSGDDPSRAPAPQSVPTNPPRSGPSPKSRPSPSPSRRAPVERPVTDPLFGLPVDPP